MKSIDIATSQNVIIQYSLASVQERMVAFIIDSVVITAIMIVASLFVGIMGDYNSTGQDLIGYFFMLPVLLFYTPVCEVLMHGQTFGKRFSNIKVVRIDGKEPVAVDYLIRWAFRMIDVFLSLGVIGILLINSSTRNQRLGGLLSNTTVVQLRPRTNINLKDVLKIDSRDSHEVKYPEVRQFDEEEMLLIKEMLDRYRRFPNEAHQKLIQELCDRLADQIGLMKSPKDRVIFLKQLIKDYVVLTR